MTPDEEIAIHFDNISRYMKECRDAVIAATIFVILIGIFFFWFITQ